MPKRPRINVSFSWETFGIIERLARISNQSKSAVVSDLLESVRHQLDELATMMETIEHARQELPEDVREALASAAETLEPIVQRAETARESLQRQLTFLADAVASDPNLCNTGVNTGVEKAEKPLNGNGS